jgi:hypothetical protein
LCKLDIAILAFAEVVHNQDAMVIEAAVSAAKLIQM